MSRVKSRNSPGFTSIADRDVWMNEGTWLIITSMKEFAWFSIPEFPSS